MRTTGVARLLRGADTGAGGIRSMQIWSLETVVRNGHMLTLSSLLTSALGAVYWAVAAHSYTTESLGRNYSAVAAMMLLAGVGQLNMTNVMIRFTPRAGQRSRRLVAAAYLARAGRRRGGVRYEHRGSGHDPQSRTADRHAHLYGNGEERCGPALERGHHRQRRRRQECT